MDVFAGFAHRVKGFGQPRNGSAHVAAIFLFSSIWSVIFRLPRPAHPGVSLDGRSTGVDHVCATSG
jgi:hypothetical protein